MYALSNFAAMTANCMQIADICSNYYRSYANLWPHSGKLPGPIVRGAYRDAARPCAWASTRCSNNHINHNNHNSHDSHDNRNSDAPFNPGS